MEYKISKNRYLQTPDGRALPGLETKGEPMTTKTQWQASDLSKAKPVVRGLCIIEFKDNKGEWQVFEILATPERVVFGGACNADFLESGYIEREEFEGLDETLSELLQDLQTYYNDGPQYVSRIVCNERL